MCISMCAYLGTLITAKSWRNHIECAAWRCNAMQPKNWLGYINCNS